MLHTTKGNIHILIKSIIAHNKIFYGYKHGTKVPYIYPTSFPYWDICNK